MAGENFFMQEVSELKKVIQDRSRMREYSPEELKQLIDDTLTERILWARENDAALFRYYEGMSFKDRSTLKYTVNESVEGLGILGKIIMDPGQFKFIRMDQPVSRPDKSPDHPVPAAFRLIFLKPENGIEHYSLRLVVIAHHLRDLHAPS